MLYPQTTLNCGGRILDLTRPKVMGILNLTPDSFYDGGWYHTEKLILRQVERMMKEGADIIDVGGMSSRPGAVSISSKKERGRIIPIIGQIAARFAPVLISVDTFRASIAKAAVEAGASIINDISAGTLDRNFIAQVAELKVPYILMHMKGIPATMQQQPSYDQLLEEVMDFLIERTGLLRAAGVADIILDVGFGFGKSIDDNYRLLQNLHLFGLQGLPILAGLSRKSMIYKFLNTTAEEALNGTTALHMAALERGANILRVHDVREAVECIKLWERLNRSGHSF